MDISVSGLRGDLNTEVAHVTWYWHDTWIYNYPDSGILPLIERTHETADDELTEFA